VSERSWHFDKLVKHLRDTVFSEHEEAATFEENAEGIFVLLREMGWAPETETLDKARNIVLDTPERLYSLSEIMGVRPEDHASNLRGDISKALWNLRVEKAKRSE
jgi:hypothetical protein